MNDDDELASQPGNAAEVAVQGARRESDDAITFADFEHEIGRVNAPLANAVRVHLGIKRSEVETKKIARAELQGALHALVGKE